MAAQNLSQHQIALAGLEETGMVLFHGTSSEHLPAIREHGLKEPYLACTAEFARYYAEEAADEAGGRPVVLRVSVEHPHLLRYDGAAMDEPVMAEESERNAAWNRAAAEHRDWLSGGCIVVPPEAWWVSFLGVGSVWHEATIPPRALFER